MKKLLLALLLLVLPSLAQGQTHPLDNMPLVPTNKYGSNNLAPEEKRTESVHYYLQSSVRVVNRNNSGSATICYYDKEKNTAYLITCGHLFSGTSTPGQANRTCEVEVYYKNNVKLDKPQKFPAKVICWDNSEDIGFMSFQPDWEIENYFSIAPVDYKINPGDVFESTGCDHAEEVASYTVEVTDGIETGRNLVTKNNSPRPGRSGGALLSPDGYYLAIVWGTSDYSGNGVGYYVPLRRIHAYAAKHPETAWLLKVGNSGFLGQIPVVSLDEPTQFPRGFVPR